ncbi:hypothetical protein ACLK2E_20205 [Escherichia coli]
MMISPIAINYYRQAECSPGRLMDSEGACTPLLPFLNMDDLQAI